MEKNIDFDRVAELYDIYVQASFDIPFWIQEAREAGGEVLELMCGTGRIGMALIEAGISYTGVDYSEGLLERFREKLQEQDLAADLLCQDARDFTLGRQFELAFIGFHSLSEVLDNEDKLKVMQQVRRHLRQGGRFTFSLQNPAAHGGPAGDQEDRPRQFELGDGKSLEFRWKLEPPEPGGRVAGWQYYTLRDQYGSTLDQRELEISFHLIEREEIEELITASGFRIHSRWGGYDRSPLTDRSPYMIFRCVS